MIRIADLTNETDALFCDGVFSLNSWKEWANRTVPAVGRLCMTDLDESLAKGLDWERDYMPVLNGLIRNGDAVGRARASFRTVCVGLEESVRKRFGRVPDADILLYPGLCNGAGWVTEAEGVTLILLGIEKIVELNWCGKDDMNGLTVHELGHVYQKQFGVLERDAERPAEAFLWQLFTEGVAMVFEQEVVGDPGYYHQDRDGWKAWCEAHLRQIAFDFAEELPTMTADGQRYFGDWVRYRSRPDTGYYLGSVFVRRALEKTPFDVLIGWDHKTVREAFRSFLENL